MPATRSFAMLLALAASAHAGTSRAWTAAKGVLPPNPEIVVGLNVVSMRSSPRFPKVLAVALDKAGISQAKLDAIKSTCGLDVVSVLDSVVVGLQNLNKGTVVIALKGATRTQLETCGAALAKADNKSFVKTAAGSLTKYSGVGDQEVYVRWLGADAFAVTTELNDNDQTIAGTKGGLAGDASLKGALAGTNTAAALWAVVKRGPDVPLGNLNAKLAMIYGSDVFSKGNHVLDIHAVLDDAQAATDLAAQSNQSISDQKSAGVGPIAALLKTLAIKATGTQVVLTASPAESDLEPLAAILAN